MLTFKKWRETYKSHGRGMDNARTPAHWAVHKDGKHVATIRPESSVHAYGGTPVYILQHHAESPDVPVEIKRIYKGGLKAAKEWAANNTDKF